MPQHGHLVPHHGHLSKKNTHIGAGNRPERKEGVPGGGWIGAWVRGIARLKQARFSKKAYILEQGTAQTQKRGSPGEAGSEPEYVL